MNTSSPERTSTHTVLGMTCDHCARSVGAQVAELPGVSDVQVDLASGRVVVTGDDVSEAAVAAAVEGAGYRVAR